MALSSEISPAQTYRLMAGVALAIFFLLGGAIFSLSRLNAPPWQTQLKPLELQAQTPRSVPEFTAQGPIDSAEKLKGRWTLLSFWSVTCPPCMEEMPALNEFALSLQDAEFAVFSVNIDQGEDADQAKAYLQEAGLTLPTHFDSQHQLKAAFGVDVYPQHALINPQGQIVWQMAGAYRWNDPKAKELVLKWMETQVPDSDPDPEE